MIDLDGVWAGDLFDRRKEAMDIIGYLETIAIRPSLRDDSHAHVLAVDAGYGQGKSYFLRRLATHLGAYHAVAFVDAWTDDLEDEPLVALAATMDEALKPWIPDNPTLAEKLSRFRAKAGQVVKIVGLGLAKRGLGFLITQAGAEALEDEITRHGDLNKDIRKDALKDAVKSISEGTDAALEVNPESTMNNRIAQFRDGQAAISEMRESLKQVVEALRLSGARLPVTIIIDELDRCRPTYAIKLLEEIKHLFDVEGVAFVLGLHSKQLSHSIKAAYGNEFDASSYLRRFITRKYTLRSVALKPLISQLLLKSSIGPDKYTTWKTTSNNYSDEYPKSFDEILAYYLDVFEIPARDVFEIIEILQTAAALTGDKKILSPLFIPLVIANILGISSDKLNTDSKFTWSYYVPTNRFGADYISMHPMIAFKRLFDERHMSMDEMNEKLNNKWSPTVAAIATLSFSNPNENYYHIPANYEILLQTVCRFEVV